MKNLANCEPVEFLTQTNKIRKAAAKWIKDTKIMEVRKNKPRLKELVEIDESMPDDKKAEIEEMNAKIKAENQKILREQQYKNLSDILDNALETHAQETAELLAMMCFVEPKDMNSHKVTEYLKEFGEIISDKDVLDFFISLMRLENLNISTFATK